MKLILLKAKVIVLNYLITFTIVCVLEVTYICCVQECVRRCSLRQKVG